MADDGKGVFTVCLKTSFDGLLARLDRTLRPEAQRAAGDQNGVFLPPGREAVRRLGLALEAGPEFGEWVRTEALDAVFLHRPWNLTEEQRAELTAAGVGVAAYHLSFDERLTTGFNPVLAAALGWAGPEVLGEKAGRPLGMVCDLPEAAAFGAVAERLRGEFGGAEEMTDPVEGKETSLRRVAVVGAMNDALVREAHAHGAGVYVTGQWRQPARAAVRETGMGVVALGHRRTEEWGLRMLGRLLMTNDQGPKHKVQGSRFKV